LPRRYSSQWALTPISTNSHLSLQAARQGGSSGLLNSWRLGGALWGARSVRPALNVARQPPRAQPERRSTATRARRAVRPPPRSDSLSGVTKAARLLDGSDDDALLALFRAMASGNDAEVRRRLDAAPALASRAIRIGASREDPAKYSLFGDPSLRLRRRHGSARRGRRAPTRPRRVPRQSGRECPGSQPQGRRAAPLRRRRESWSAPVGPDCTTRGDRLPRRGRCRSRRERQERRGAAPSSRSDPVARTRLLPSSSTAQTRG
jgi:hypothetical protein